MKSMWKRKGRKEPKIVKVSVRGIQFEVQEKEVKHLRELYGDDFRLIREKK